MHCTDGHREYTHLTASVKIPTLVIMDASKMIISRTFPTGTLILALLFTTTACNACQPGDVELTESKFYRSPVVVQASVSTTQGDGVVVRVDRTLKPSNGSGVVTANAEITLTGFGTEDPCFWEVSDLSDSSVYFFFFDNLNENGVYPIVANPVEASKKKRKAIRKFMQEGEAPAFAKELKNKMYAQGGRATLSCVASGYPSPQLTMTKDGVTLSKGVIKGIAYKSGKGGIRLKFKNLQKDRHEGVYACIADDGVHPQIMTSATLEICTLSCENGELSLKRCECQCEKGWNGLRCNIPLQPANTSIPTCNLDCGSHGRVQSEQCQCQCDDNYFGDTCDKMCDKTCDHGTLDQDTCSCQCDVGYFGDTCRSTADQLCNNGSYCHHRGTCYQVEDGQTRELVFLCRCSTSFTGDRCEIPTCNLDCGPHGRIDDTECRCVCDDDYRGADCRMLDDDHTGPCGPEYDHYCMNGGTCFILKGIMKPSCRCPMLYYGVRCDLLQPELDCGCLNGGECQYNETKHRYECNCLKKFTGERCQYKALPPSRPKANTQDNSRKMIITICVIFLAMLIVIGLVVIVYVRNRNAREKERREKLEEIIRSQRNGMRLRASLQSTGAGGSYPADDIEMTSFRSNPNQQPQVTMESEQQPSDGCQAGSAAAGNGPKRSSQTSLHSRSSQGEVRGSPSTKGGKEGKEGYQAVPTQEPTSPAQLPAKDSDTSLEGPGDPDTLPAKHPRASSDLGSESDESEAEGDVIDVPNPQIQALQDHLGGSDHDSGDYTWDEHSSPGLRITSPYAHDASPLHQPRGTGHLNDVESNRPADQVNIRENPLMNQGSKTDAMNNVMAGSPKDAYYADRLKDVVEGSPPSAV